MASRRDAVWPAVERVMDALEETGLTPAQREDLAVALTEALSNAAVHGNRLRPEVKVRITVRVQPRGVAVDVADSGKGFDVAALADPTEPARLLAPGGRGVFLMRRLVDRVDYNEAGNRVRLTVSRR